jgi:ribonuclease HI
VVPSPSGVYIYLSIRLEFACTNSQVEYESLLCGLEFLRDCEQGTLTCSETLI